MTKLVNIQLQGRPITALKYVIKSNTNNVTLTTEEIKAILEEHNGIVREVFPDGTLITLNLENYNNPNLYQEFKAKQDAEKRKMEDEAKERVALKNTIKANRRSLKEAFNHLKSGKPINSFVTLKGVQPQTTGNQVVDSVRAKIEANKK